MAKIEDEVKTLPRQEAAEGIETGGEPAAPAAPATPTGRDAVLGRLRERYPDKSFDDDESVWNQIGDDYASSDKQLGEYRDREKSLGDLFRRDPKSAAFLNNWRNGADPVVELVRQFGSDIVAALDDPERQEAIAEANKEYLDRLAKSKGFEDEYQGNLRESLETLDRMQEERGLSDEDIDGAMTWLVETARDVELGKFTEDVVDMALKAKGYDAAVAHAGHAGEVRGRNAKIRMGLKQRGSGDGLPALDGGNNSPVERGRPELGALNSMAGNDIWSRGNERRVKNRQV